MYYIACFETGSAGQDGHFLKGMSIQELAPDLRIFVYVARVFVRSVPGPLDGDLLCDNAGCPA